MNTNQGYYFNSKCFSAKNHRISVFGKEKEGKLEITEIWCSPKDNYSKKVAKEAYLSQFKEVPGFNRVYKPKIYKVPIMQGNTPKYEFKEWCKKNYFHKKQKLVEKVVDYIQKGDKIIYLKKRK